MNKYDIMIIEEVYKHGYVSGIMDEFKWFALVYKEESSCGIDPNTLKKGQGRITRLCLYKETIEETGNPFKLTYKTNRYIYANYARKWEILNVNYLEYIKKLVEYLERRYSIKLLK